MKALSMLILIELSLIEIWSNKSDKGNLETKTCRNNKIIYLKNIDDSLTNQKRINIIIAVFCL